jgi:broad-specificity NMP kinase
MIILINGAFGVGKTSVATELHNRMKNSMVYDPEVIGYMLRHIITDEIKKPHERTDDFQDLTLWKQLVVDVAKAVKKEYERPLIVPMTIYKKDYLHYILKGFREIDANSFHYLLTAKKETIHQRLLNRGEEEGNWCFQQTDKCLRGYRDEIFENKIETDNLQISEIVDIIMEQVFLQNV